MEIMGILLKLIEKDAASIEKVLGHYYKGNFRNSYDFY